MNAAGTYGSAHTGASSAALPAAAATPVPASCRTGRPIRSTMTVGPMAR